MTKPLEVYKCEICGNIVEILHQAGGELVCCGQPMTLMTERLEDQGYEKHLPVIERDNKNVKVKIGSVPHPMEENHYIEWVEVVGNSTILRKHLNPGDKPEATFEYTEKMEKAREYCSVHGLWSQKE